MSRTDTITLVTTGTPHATSQLGLSVISDGGSEAVYKHPSPSRATTAGASTEPQPQQLPHGFVVQQQPTTSVSAIHSWDQRVLQPQGLAGVKTAAAAAAVASGPSRYWMPKPQMSPWCPPGLECLTALDQLTFFDLMLEMPLGEDYSTHNRRLPRRFQVLNSEGQQVYWVDMRVSSVASHFETVFLDRTGEELITVKTKALTCPAGCCGGACSSCRVEATVEAPPGNAVGSVTQSRGTASFVINVTDGSSFRLEASVPPGFCICTTTDTLLMLYEKFVISSLDYKHLIGSIETQQTLFTPYSWRLLSNFALSFPADLDVRSKATLSGAATMLHFYYYGNTFLQVRSRRVNN